MASETGDRETRGSSVIGKDCSYEVREGFHKSALRMLMACECCSVPQSPHLNMGSFISLCVCAHIVRMHKKVRRGH